MALWAVVLGLVMVFMAIATARADVQADPFDGEAPAPAHVSQR